MSEAIIGVKHPITCEMPECASQKNLEECYDLEDNRILACASCWSDWPNRLIVLGT